MASEKMWREGLEQTLADAGQKRRTTDSKLAGRLAKYWRKRREGSLEDWGEQVDSYPKGVLKKGGKRRCASLNARRCNNTTGKIEEE